MLFKSIVLTVLTTIPLAAHSQAEQWEWNHMWGGGMFFGWMMWFWMAVLFVFAVWVVKNTSYRNSNGKITPSDSAALGVLKERLANGEINKDEYMSLKQTLES